MQYCCQMDTYQSKHQLAPRLGKYDSCFLKARTEIQENGCISCPTLTKCSISYKKDLKWWKPTTYDEVYEGWYYSKGRGPHLLSLPRTKMQQEHSDSFHPRHLAMRYESVGWLRLPLQSLQALCIFNVLVKNYFLSLFLKTQPNLKGDQQTTYLKNCHFSHLKRKTYAI